MPACAEPEPVVAAIRALDDLTVQLSDGGAGGKSKGDFAANIASIIRSHPQLEEVEKDALIWWAGRAGRPQPPAAPPRR